MYPAGVAGLSTRFLTVDGGIRLRMVEGGPRDAHPLLLVHGWGGFTYSFAETIPALLHAGYRVLAVELPGHGLSDKPADDSWYSSASLEATVKDVIARERLESFSYIGHSMGGLIGLRLAADHQLPGLERLALISSAGLGRIPALLPLKLLSPRVVNRVVPSLLTRRVVQGILTLAFGTESRPTEHDVDQYWAQTQWDEYAWACRASAHRVDFRRVPAARLRALTVPVLVISGARDRVVARVARHAAAIPTARLLHVPEGGHLVMQECAERTNSELLSFLSGVR
jgi:pimeloyl-ACP methyl ester carboxylesterase